MTLNTQESRALVDEIALAPSAASLSDLLVDVRREYGADVRGSFIELLLALRAQALERVTRGVRVGVGSVYPLSGHVLEG